MNDKKTTRKNESQVSGYFRQRAKRILILTGSIILIAGFISCSGSDDPDVSDDIKELELELAIEKEQEKNWERAEARHEAKLSAAWKEAEEERRLEGVREKAEMAARNAKLLKQREADYRDAKEYAANQLRNMSLFPNLNFSKKLGLGDVTLQPVPQTAAMIRAIRAGLKKGDWLPFLDLMKIEHGHYTDAYFNPQQDTKFTLDEMKIAFLSFGDSTSSSYQPFRFQVFISTKVKLGHIALVYRTKDVLDGDPDYGETHPDGSGWILPYHPFMQEGFVVPHYSLLTPPSDKKNLNGMNTLDYSNGLTGVRAIDEIRSALATAKRLRELGKAVPKDSQIRQKIVREEYEKLRKIYMGPQVKPADKRGAAKKLEHPQPDDDRGKVAAKKTDTNKSKPFQPKPSFLPDGPPGEVRRFDGHSGVVYCVNISPDSTTGVSGGENGEVILWDLATGKDFARLSYPEGDVRAVAFSRNGDRVLAAGAKGVLRLWDVQTKREVQEFKGKGTTTIFCAHFTPDGSRIITGDFLGMVNIFDAQMGQQVRQIHAHKPSMPGVDVSVPGIDVSTDGSVVASASRDGTVRLWNTSTGKETGRYEGHDSDVWCVAFSPDGGRALSGGKDVALHLWNTETGQPVRHFQEHNGTVVTVSFLPDGNRAISGNSGRGGAVRLWNVQSGKEIRSFDGHKWGVRGIAISSDGRFVLTASADKTVRLLRIPSQKDSSSRATQSDPKSIDDDKTTQLPTSGVIVLERR